MNNPSVEDRPGAIVSSVKFALEPDHPQRLASLCGLANDNLKMIAERLDVRIHNRGNQFEVRGEPEQIAIAETALKQLYQETRGSRDLTPDAIHLSLQPSETNSLRQSSPAPKMHDDKLYVVHTPKLVVRPRGGNQKRYVHNVLNHDINFGVGPAGTGKTYLAVACAVQALQQDEVRRILLVRPAVEAGEKLGFLPGDLSQKVDPYLRPLYDALYDMLGFEKVDRLIERNVIEVAPLAYMRGRTLSHSFIILDESQNTTREQMKMFLTRIGFGSTAVITGDPTQIDLPRGQSSGLRHALEVLADVPGISFTHFDSADVVRHPLVQRIVDAYESKEQE
ncbi:PhoH family protein [Reinekea marinisedimentorum]|uniref:PhoH-like protein n=1 Tax=Reinekea marinisedimentorum TaxID=230495 RepID=A0A4R3I186_9GAMM|nr:PhoH family protein [Reinekea marinisedimentorum]TCS37609.1 phosphate starvation-inducible protein PhoH [Reinekea marinisedimentorum]